MSHAPIIDATPETPPRTSGVVMVLAFAGIVVSLMHTLVIPLVPDLPQLLNANPADATWAVTATLLAAAVSTPVMGRLGDMYGKRRMLLVSLTVLVAGSVVAGLAGSLIPMVVGRALQGLSGGVIPLGIGIMRDELPRERLGAATATMSSSLGVGAALGLPAAALIADNLSWHMLFWTSAAAGGIAVVLVHVFVPESPIRTGGRFDLTGAAGLSVALVCLLLAISKGTDWDSRVVIGLFITAAVVLLAWGWWELRSARQPLVNLRTAARPQVLLTNLSAGTLGFATFALSLVLPQVLQLPVATGYGLGESMLVVGLVMAPQGLVMMFVSSLSARISQAWGPKATLMLGTAVVAAGYALGILLMSEIWQLVLVSCVIGAGVGFAYGALPTLIMSAVPVSETAAANSLNTLLRAIGSSVSSAVVGVVLAKMTTTFGVPSLAGLRTVLAIGAGAALAALIIASFLPRADHRLTRSTTSEAGSPTDG